MTTITMNTIETGRIQAWARGWNDAMSRREPPQDASAGYALGYLDAIRGMRQVGVRFTTQSSENSACNLASSVLTCS